MSYHGAVWRLGLSVVALAGCAGVFGLSDKPADDASGDARGDAPDLDANCPDTYAPLATGSYHAVPAAISFSAAQAACLTEGPAAGVTGHTHLVVFANSETTGENNVVYNFASQTFGSAVPFWVGASGMNADNEYRWVTDELPEPVDMMPPWRPGQPDHPSDCVLMPFDFAGLEPFGCTFQTNYVCECDAHVDVPTNY